MDELCFQNSHFVLMNSQVSHFNCKAMESDSFDTLLDIVCQVTLTNFVNALKVWDRAVLVEFSE